MPLDNRQPMPFSPPWGRKSCLPTGLPDPTFTFLGLSQWVPPGVAGHQTLEQWFPTCETPLAGVTFQILTLLLITVAKVHLRISKESDFMVGVTTIGGTVLKVIALGRLRTATVEGIHQADSKS